MTPAIKARTRNWTILRLRGAYRLFYEMPGERAIQIRKLIDDILAEEYQAETNASRREEIRKELLRGTR